MSELLKIEAATLADAWCEWHGHDHPLDALTILTDEHIPPCPSATEFVNDLGPLIADLIDARVKAAVEMIGVQLCTNAACAKAWGHEGACDY